MTGIQLSASERTRILEAEALVGRAGYGKKIMDIGKQLEVRTPKDHRSAESTLYRIATDPTSGMVGWMKDLVLLTADEILKVEAENASADDLRQALHEERQRTEDYRESALRKEAVIRGKQAEIDKLQAQLDQQQTTTNVIGEVEQEALVILQEIVMAENGDLDPLLLKASRLVLRAAQTDRS